MPLDPDDRAYLQRLRHTVQERGVKLVLDKSRAADPAYVVEVRKHHPLNTTEPQWRLACEIRDVLGLPLDLKEATNAFYCSTYIEKNLQAFSELVPSKKERSHAYQVAKRHHVNVPREVLLSRKAYAEWIATFSKSDVAEVLDIIQLLGWGSGKIKRVMERQGFENLESWTRSLEFIDWMIETHGRLLHDPRAAEKAKCNEAEEMLRRGHNLWSVAENLNLPDATVAEIAKRVGDDPEKVHL